MPTPAPAPRRDLEHTLALKQVAHDVYANTQRLHVPPGARGVFGGTLVAQALWAAMLTVPTEFVPHSLHSYFVNGGDGKNDIEYRVGRLRDGKSFVLREVKAFQGETLVFVEQASFAKLKAGSDKLLNHAKEMPRLDFFKFYTARESFQRGMVDTGIVSQSTFEGTLAYFDRFEQGPLEYRFEPKMWHTFKNDDDYHRLPHEIDVDSYLKLRIPLRDPRFNYIAMAYYSDSHLLLTVSKFFKKPVGAIAFSVSLDHTIYFHREPKVNDWNLFHVTHPRSGDSRHILHGAFYDKDSGNHVASVIQEGLVIMGGEPKL